MADRMVCREVSDRILSCNWVGRELTRKVRQRLNWRDRSPRKHLSQLINKDINNTIKYNLIEKNTSGES